MGSFFDIRDPFRVSPAGGAQVLNQMFSGMDQGAQYSLQDLLQRHQQERALAGQQALETQKETDATAQYNARQAAAMKAYNEQAGTPAGPGTTRIQQTEITPEGLKRTLSDVQTRATKPEEMRVTPEQWKQLIGAQSALPFSNRSELNAQSTTGEKLHWSPTWDAHMRYMYSRLSADQQNKMSLEDFIAAASGMEPLRALGVDPDVSVTTKEGLKLHLGAKGPADAKQQQIEQQLALAERRMKLAEDKFAASGGKDTMSPADRAAAIQEARDISETMKPLFGNFMFGARAASLYDHAQTRLNSLLKQPSGGGGGGDGAVDTTRIQQAIGKLPYADQADAQSALDAALGYPEPHRSQALGALSKQLGM